MELKGEQQIAAPRETVWEALNDPEVLRQCIPGCEEIEKTSDTSFDAKVKAKVGPVSAKFSGSVTLSDIDPPNGYRISGEGKGGAAGFAKGSAKVTLEEIEAGTHLAYDVEASVGGKLAQIGSRLIDSTARKYADTFFSRFREIVEGEDTGEAAMAPLGTEEPAAGSAPVAATEEVTEETAEEVSEEAAEAAAPERKAAEPAATAAEAEAEAPAPKPQPEVAPEPAPEGGANTWIWVGGLIIVVVLILLIFLG